MTLAAEKRPRQYAQEIIGLPLEQMGEAMLRVPDHLRAWVELYVQDTLLNADGRREVRRVMKRARQIAALPQLAQRRGALAQERRRDPENHERLQRGVAYFHARRRAA